MHIQRLEISGFRCFGPNPIPIYLDEGLTAFVGVNGAGKTAVMLALQRLFGVTPDQRRLRRQDFHVPAAEVNPPNERRFTIEAVLAFPELDDPLADASAVPEFFSQMATDDSGRMKCRLRMEAVWTDDGSIDGAIEHTYRAVRTMGAFTDAECSDLKPKDRARIQLIYVPASRDGISQVTAFLRGRLWRAISWSEGTRTTFASAGSALNNAFSGEPAVDAVVAAVTRRWQQVHTAGTDTTPVFRPIDLRFEQFIRKAEVLFRPDEAGRERGLDELSDGQRSLFHLAMTAATLDVESNLATDPRPDGFQPGGISIPALTLIAVEEPENNLAPFYLSRIVRQIQELTAGSRAQAMLSSHSPSILARVKPEQVRHFRLDPKTRACRVRGIRLPPTADEASKFVREAVRTYPELYFARFVILGEGASEEVVLPRLAEALGLDIDRSFVAVVPLGGRHVNHLWRLLVDLDIPHATLLDLDYGRAGGGWGRIKTVCAQLMENGVRPDQLFQTPSPAGPSADLAAFDTFAAANWTSIQTWARSLRRFNVFFCEPLDLDYSMLMAMQVAYSAPEPGRSGPSPAGEPRDAVLGDGGIHALYDFSQDSLLRWYRYLFLGRGKPSTHVRVLSGLDSPALASAAPEELKALLGSVAAQLDPPPPAGPMAVTVSPTS
ncbi:MAG: AAA family ATPase [Alphaproteobacteria bacterium]|nr:AAA family ATPase [Alphaproteobacteria bacterium]